MKIVLGLGTIGVLGQVDLGESNDIQRITEKRYQQETFKKNLTLRRQVVYFLISALCLHKIMTKFLI